MVVKETPSKNGLSHDIDDRKESGGELIGVESMVEYFFFFFLLSFPYLNLYFNPATTIIYLFLYFTTNFFLPSFQILPLHFFFWTNQLQNVFLLILMRREWEGEDELSSLQGDNKCPCLFFSFFSKNSFYFFFFLQK